MKDQYEVRPDTVYRLANPSCHWLASVGFNTPLETKIYAAAFAATRGAPSDETSALCKHGKAFIVELVHAGVVIPL